MAARKDEIAAILKEQIKHFGQDLRMEEVGVVVEVGDGIARVWGLEHAVASELLEFPGEIYGLVLDLEEDSVGVALMGPDDHIKEGDQVRRTGRILETPVGESFLGRVVDPLGKPLDGKGPVKPEGYRKTDAKAPGVLMRQPVDTPLQTGIKVIDALTPIGRGQRELIIGDRRTGKTAIAVDTIINQKAKGSTASMSPSAKSPPPWPRWWMPCVATGPWSTPSWWPLPPRIRLLCSTSPPTPDAPWASTSAIRAGTP